MPCVRSAQGISTPGNGRKLVINMANVIWTYDGVILRIDAEFGIETRKQFQRFLKLAGHYKGIVDGDWGKMSQTSMQQWLRHDGYYPSSKFKIDGVAGTSTWDEFRKLATNRGFKASAVIPVSRRRYEQLQKMLNAYRIGKRYDNGKYTVSGGVYL